MLKWAYPHLSIAVFWWMIPVLKGNPHTVAVLWDCQKSYLFCYQNKASFEIDPSATFPLLDKLNDHDLFLLPSPSFLLTSYPSPNVILPRSPSSIDFNWQHFHLVIIHQHFFWFTKPFTAHVFMQRVVLSDSCHNWWFGLFWLISD